MTQYGKAISLREVNQPGRFLIYNNSNRKRRFMGFTTDVLGDDNRRYGVFIGTDPLNGIIYINRVSGMAWDVTDFVEIEIEPQHVESIGRDSLAHGNMFLGPIGEVCLVAGKNGAGSLLAFDIHKGAPVDVPTECLILKSWRLVARDKSGVERFAFDPDDYQISSMPD